MLCAATSTHGVLHHHATLGPYNTQRLLTFLSDPQDVVLGREQQDHEQVEHPVYVIMWAKYQFSQRHLDQRTIHINREFIAICRPPYAPYLNPKEEFFFSRQWKVCDRQFWRGVFPLLPGQGECGLWCGWSPVAWPSMYRHDAEW